MKYLLLTLLIITLTSCTHLESFVEMVKGSPIAQDTNAFMKAAGEKDWAAMHVSALTLQEYYVVVKGAKRIDEDYSPACVEALGEHFEDATVGSIQVVRESELVWLFEVVGKKLGMMSRVDAITIGRVIHVGKGKVVPLPHEIVHTAQWDVLGEMFVPQYYAGVLVVGYKNSWFEVVAMRVQENFVDHYGDVCTNPV